MLEDEIEDLNQKTNDALEKFIFKDYLRTLAASIHYISLTDEQRAQNILLQFDEVTRLKISALIQKMKKNYETSKEINFHAKNAFITAGFNGLDNLCAIVDYYDMDLPDIDYIKRKFEDKNPVFAEKAKKMFVDFYKLGMQLNKADIKKLYSHIDKDNLGIALSETTVDKENKDDDDLYNYKYERLMNLRKLILENIPESMAKDLLEIIKQNESAEDEEIRAARRGFIQELVEAESRGFIELNKHNYFGDM